ncbi:UDP-N-acetylmuramate dehydrogenase [Caballeronia sp. LZ062]|uniref:UDP-N-acetylmuramate dehydrogenase n=1 Tax=unclassified Caballeronia TaxID=2646786 RepID=UPI002859C4FC|nr:MULTISPECIES: UDP-N-acetylmuramate dehydrogenase [unclassified Caballeronia]MDR5855297.1 UDP-N-acetylmuramate dehydrogenase [Caballeronia sp. LZ050]MDR5870174.1 UDP-N-acetylmuramate dehydrogenase [Caballeronia sp. LZ062]
MSDAFFPAPALFADYSLRPHNTFGFDVRARHAMQIGSVEAAAALATDTRIAGMPRLVLGGGSNVVLTRDFDGVALIVGIMGKRVIGEDEDAYLVEAGAGENWHAFVAWTLAHGMPGLENLALIPGTVGAAPIQNVGAYGLEMGERFERLHAVELATGARVEFDRDACAFGYRDSFFKRAGRGRFLITSVVFRLPKAWTPRADYADVARALEGASACNAQAIFDAVIAVRRAKLPDWTLLGNAGSFFKNPVVNAEAFDALRAREPGVVSYAQPDGSVKLAAGWLIDQCGWKGRGIGGAAVHERQALVLVNRGGATGAQVLQLAEAIKRDVLGRFGVELEMEPVVV